jgi:hypothetical protein
MLRIYFLQQWFGLFDPAMEEALGGSADPPPQRALMFQEFVQ